MSAIKMRNLRRFTLFGRRGFAATSLICAGACPPDERPMNANRRKLNAKNLTNR
jgi:hypothetical protein